MATTAYDLLTLVHEEARRLERPTVEQAETAITALGYAARQLQRIADADRVSNSERWTAVRQVIAACQAASTAWPTRPGRLPDLLGAACDLLAGYDQELATDERWAVAVQISRAARHIIDVALRCASYARVPTLHWVRASAVEVERHAAHRPAKPGSAMVLDLPVPAPHPVEGARPVVVLNAAANLARALRQDCAAGALPISAALATLATGEDAARRCATFASNSGRISDAAWRHAPDAWLVAYAALVRFHDGSRRRNAELSESVHAALELQHALARIDTDDHIDADAATALRAVANQLPLLARTLGHSARTWGRERLLYARARDLLHTDELVPAILHHATVPADPEHLVPVVAAFRATERLSAALSAELTQTAGRLGHQPQPYLAAAHAAQTNSRHLQTDAAWTARLVKGVESHSGLAL